MSSDLLVDLQEDLAGEDSANNALDQLKLSPMDERHCLPDDVECLSKSGKYT